MRHLEDKHTQFAYLSIHDFFGIYDLTGAQYYLHEILRAAGSKKVWKKGSPCNLLYYVKHVKELVEAAFYIDDNYQRREEGIITGDDEKYPAVDELMAAAGPYRPLWACFPRHITAPQFFNPYLAIEEFCRYKTSLQWREALDEILEFAFSRQSASDLYPPFNFANLQRKLARLLDACYLLEVRTYIRPGTVTPAKTAKSLKKKQ